MRYTRIRQLKKLGKKYRVANRTIHLTRSKQYADELDPTFKWHRDFEGWGENWIEFGGDDCSYGELICVKGKNLHLK